MFFDLIRKFLNYPKTRLKSPGHFFGKRALALFNKPAVGWCCWFLVWLTAVLLVCIPVESDVMRLFPGQLSPVTIVTAIEFESPLTFSDGSGLQNRPDVIAVPKGTILVERGQNVTQEIIEKVHAYQIKVSRLDPFFKHVLKIVGVSIILLLGVIVTAAFFHLIKPDMAHRNSMIFLFFLLSLLSMVPCKWCLYLNEEFYRFLPSSTIDYLLPMALAPLLAAILMGPLPAIVVGLWVSFAVSVFAGYSFTVFTIGFVSAIVIARMTRFVRTRSSIFRLGLWGGFAGAVCAIGFSVLTYYMWDVIIIQCMVSLASGILSALIALLILPLLEVLFGISTDISLLELSDMEHPLLKRLSIEAPGTYHHSLMVANLAQAAVAAVGGNALRISICSYFHDIGKLVKPSFFSENIQSGDNPHDDLSPSMSTLVIISHVKEGVDLALRHKLPLPIVEAIQQHHGTGLVSYFYHKASAQLELDLQDKSKHGISSDVSEEDFRYPGPKPKSRETAILCLADSIEAASRSLEKISPSHIEHLVHDIIDEKLNDGQLDLCNLTLAEIGKLKKVFVFTLTNMLHGRISYPVDENRAKQQTDDMPSERARNKKTRAPVHGSTPSP